MADETKNQNPSEDSKANKERLKKLETDIKIAFKEERFSDVKKISEDIKSIDPENHLAVRMVEKVDKIERNRKEKEEAAKKKLDEIAKVAKAKKAKKENAEKIKNLEKELKAAFKKQDTPEAKRLMDEIKTLEAENKFVQKIQKKLDAEKMALDKKIKKEKINGLTKEAKEFLKNEEWDKVKEKSDELLKLDPKLGFALKAIKKIEKATGKINAAPVPIQKKDVSKVAKKEPKKPGFFARLFSKKTSKTPEAKVIIKPDEAKKPIEPMAAKPIEAIKPPATPVAPMAPAKPLVPAPQLAKAQAVTTPTMPAMPVMPKKEAMHMPVAKLSEIPKKVEPTPKKAIPQAATGNIFTSLFGKNEVASTLKKPVSIIDTIVAKSEQAKEEKKQEKEKVESTGEGLVKFSNLFLKFALAFIAVSYAFFYAQLIDTQNRVFSLLDQENYAIQLHNVSRELEGKSQEEKRLGIEIKRYEEGYQDTSKDVITRIVDNRMDWPDLLRKLNEVTESVYEKNTLLQYVTYNNYNYDVDTGKLSLSATLSDPKGRNLTKLAELEVAFQSFPRDPDNEADERKPYFYGLQEFNSYAKTFSSQTGRYISNFSLNLYTKEQENNQ